MSDIEVICDDCLAGIATVPDGSIDAIITDPPYPEIDRPYGRMTEAEWDAMMRRLIPECRRVLKPHGSAVFVLQPNSEKIGRMRPWLWEFMAWTCREWNQVQDIWWWNYAAMPTAQAIQGRLTRASLKACVWLGASDCYRDQDAILWEESQRTTALRLAARAGKQCHSRPSPWGYDKDDVRCYEASEKRGGVTPFNVLPMTNADPYTSAGSHGHGAGTPDDLADWWIRYITRPDDVVLDMFAGTGTIPLAAYDRGRKALAIERNPVDCETIRARLRHRVGKAPLFALAEGGAA